MIRLARIIITILFVPFVVLMLGIVALIAVYEILWNSDKWAAKTQGPDKI